MSDSSIRQKVTDTKPLPIRHGISRSANITVSIAQHGSKLCRCTER